MCDIVNEDIVIKEEIVIEEGPDLNVALIKQEIKQEPTEIEEYDVKPHERPFQCEMCSKSFALAKNLKSHLKTHSAESSKKGKKKSYKCNQCSKAFDTPYILAKHRANEHGNGGNFPCEMCGKRFHLLSRLKSHQLKYKSGSNIKCDECNKMFKTTRSVAVHKKRAHATEKPFKCKVCSKSFAGAGLLNDHFKNHNVERAYKCDQCFKAFKKEAHLTKHKLDIHVKKKSKSFATAGTLSGNGESSSENHIKCDQCDKRFQCVQYLSAHKSRAHATERPFRCEVCPKSFATAGILNTHLRNHSAETAYKCGQCSKAFNRPYALAKHKAHEHGNGGDFPCEICGKKFLFSNSLKVHRLKHTGEKMKCVQCDKVFKNTRTFYIHQKYGHAHGGRRFLISSKLKEQKVANMKCDECDMVFKSTSGLSIHKSRAHATERPFQCEVCPKSFSTVGIFRAHLRNHDVEQPYKCDDCSKTFDTLYAFTKHKAHEHGNGGDFVCDECGKRFLFSNSLKVHRLKHTEENIKCDQCDKVFKNTRTLSMHKNHVHATKKRFQCEMCPESFSTLLYLNRHSKYHGAKTVSGIKVEIEEEAEETIDELTHTNKNNGKGGGVPCKICGKKFSSSSLKRHELMHTSQNNIKCDQCDKNFKSVEYLSAHKNRVHATERPFQCDVCPKSFATTRILKDHLRKHTLKEHDKTRSSSEHEHATGTKNTIECDQCDKKFKCIRYLFAHKSRAHPTERPFQCEVCPKSFATAGILKTHLRNHSVETPYKCDRCPKAFNTPYALTKHKAHEHGNGGDFPCDLCGRRFLLSNSLKVHRLKHTEGKGKMFGSAYKSRAHAAGKPFRCDQFEDVDVKTEPEELYDPEEQQTVSVIKVENEEEIDVGVKQEREDFDESL